MATTFWRFQSTRLSRASTCRTPHVIRNVTDFNPQGSREPRRVHFFDKAVTSPYFNPQGSREPRRNDDPGVGRMKVFQSTRLSRASTNRNGLFRKILRISIHKALASLDLTWFAQPSAVRIFQSTRLSRASTHDILKCLIRLEFQSTRLSRASTVVMALAMGVRLYFNPQGSREPRRIGGGARSGRIIFQSTRLSRASTIQPWVKRISRFNFNPQGSREPRLDATKNSETATQFQSTRLSRASTVLAGSLEVVNEISIHKALASLDTLVWLESKNL